MEISKKDSGTTITFWRIITLGQLFNFQSSNNLKSGFVFKLILDFVQAKTEEISEGGYIHFHSSV